MRHLTLFLLLVGMAGPLAYAATDAMDARPNIVFLLADDLRYDCLGATGNAIIETPNIDRLAAEGVSFNRAFVTTSICMISRASIMTGQHACRHGVTRFDHQLTAEQLDNTYFGRLRDAGYRLGFVGKWGVGAPPNGLFDFNAGYAGQGNYYGPPTTPDKHLTQFLGEQAREFLADRDDQRPFCLSVSFKSPHVDDGNTITPFNFDRRLAHLYEGDVIPPPPLADEAFFRALPEFLRNSENRIRWQQRFSTPELYQKSVKGYYRLISGMDRVIGDIRSQLAALGLDDNTIVVFSSDHGFYLGERGFAGKWYPHEVSLQIPLIIQDPRLTPAQQSKTSNAMALNIDIAPTLLDYAGVGIPTVMQGFSLRPCVEGTTPRSWRTEFYYDHPFDYGTIPMTEGVRTERFKYILYHGPEGAYEELFNLQEDHNEATNLAGNPDYEEQLAELRASLRRLRENACKDRLARQP